MPGYLADFDSATAMLRALARFLHGKDFPAVGQTRLLEPLAEAVNLLPAAARRRLFAIGGALETVSERRLGQFDADAVARWMAGQYPRRRYPVVAVGSSCGALVHLFAAMDAPWLPQTFLIPVRQPAGDLDDMEAAARRARAGAERLLAANPDLQLHHMHDPNHDRLMVRYLSYFRVKRRSLGAAYEDFLRSSLDPGGVILLVECRRHWPVRRMGERHYFQPGAMGGAHEREYLEGGPRVASFLAANGSHYRRWRPPPPDAMAPEAEWGFEPALARDVCRFAAIHGFRVARIVYQEPEDPSPLVADLYRRWYRSRGIPGNRLLAESFILIEPYWALRTGSVPFWMKFNMEPSARRLERYLRARPPFAEVYANLFPNGVAGIGWAAPDRWKQVLALAGRRGSLLGVDEAAYPSDFGALGRYHRAVKSLPARHPLPGRLSLDQVLDLAAERRGRYRVETVPPRKADL